MEQGDIVVESAVAGAGTLVGTVSKEHMAFVAVVDTFVEAKVDTHQCSLKIADCRDVDSSELCCAVVFSC